MNEGVMLEGALSLPAREARQPGFLSLLWLGTRAHGIFLQIALLYFLVVQSLVAFMPGFQSRNAMDVLSFFALSTIPSLLVMLFFFKVVEMIIHERPKRPVIRLLAMMWSVLGNRYKMAVGLPMVFALLIFMYGFAMIKANITVFQPFAWDVTFDRWDVALHFGVRPWELLQPILGHAPITFLINVNYNVWFFVMQMFWVYYAFLANPGRKRTEFFLSFMLLWLIGGGLLATVFSSAGPCFFGEGRLGFSPDPYAGLMAYLHQANASLPVWAVSTQDMLWSLREQQSAFGGVSAMPSMHNATALLFVLASGGFPRWVRVLVILHAVLVFLGSVHLAWHYAVDAYLAWGVTLLVWWGVKPLAVWWESSGPERAFRSALGLEKRADTLQGYA
jgi:PAP2 superfamily